MSRVFKDRFFWYIVILTALVGLLSISDGLTTSGDRLHQVFIPIQRLAFTLAVLLAAWRFGTKAGWQVCTIAGSFILGRHLFPSISMSLYDAASIFVELGLVVISLISSWFIGKYHEGTKRLQASERDLRRASEEWQATFDSIADPIMILDKDSRILRANKASEKTTGVQLQALIGSTCFQVIHGTTEHPSACPHKQMLEKRIPVRAELFDSMKDIFLEVTVSPVFNDSGDIIGTVHISRDITESKKIQEKLIITDRLASIGELSAGIAHEINNPLTGIIGFAELLMEKEIPVDIREDVEIIYKEAQRTATVIRNMLTFARKQESQMQSACVNDIIRQTLELRAHDHQISNIRVKTNLASDLPEITASITQLQQVFLNLIINAEYSLKTTHNGGNLTITTLKNDGVIQIAFCDDGLGIEKQNINKLFNPFFTTKPAGKGTGLGLSICHGIITAHGGRIWVESELGYGATFYIELPIPQFNLELTM